MNIIAFSNRYAVYNGRIDGMYGRGSQVFEGTKEECEEWINLLHIPCPRPEKDEIRFREMCDIPCCPYYKDFEDIIDTMDLDILSALII